MLSLAGFAMIALFLALIMTGRLSALVALALIPVGFGCLLAVAALFGPRERRRVGILSPDQDAALEHGMEEAPACRRPRLMPFNLGLTGALLAGLVTGILPLPILFILATALALAVTYPSLAEQRERLEAHSYNVVSVVGLIFAAAIFTGVLSGTGMDDAMSQSLLAVMPDSLGPFMDPATGLVLAMLAGALAFGVIPLAGRTA